MTIFCVSHKFVGTQKATIDEPLISENGKAIVEILRVSEFVILFLASANSN